MNLFPSLCVIYVMVFCIGASMANRRSKRLINGIPVNNPSDFNTQFMVAITQASFCTYKAPDAPEDGNEDFGWCDKYDHYCGGSLIRPDFVLTACHCVIHEDFYDTRVPRPHFNEDYKKFTTSTTVEPWVDDVYVRMQPRHPIYNKMALWMGGVDQGPRGGRLQQRRFAKAFFPHSECIWREIHILYQEDPSSWRDHLAVKKPGYDVGLVRTWADFKVNKDIQLVPLIFGDDLEKAQENVVRKMSVCITFGWGQFVEGVSSSKSDVLRYGLRHVFCNSVECYGDTDLREGGDPSCQLCTSSIARPDKGISNIDIGHQDSGGPLLCRHENKRFQIGVVSRSFEKVHNFPNLSYALYFSLKCASHLLTNKHTDYLRSLHEDEMKSQFKDYRLDVNKVPMGSFTDKNN